MVGSLVALVLIFVIVDSASEEDQPPSESEAEATTTPTVAGPLAPIDAACSARRDQLLASLTSVSTLVNDIRLATTPEELQQLATRTDGETQALLAEVRALRDAVATTTVSADASIQQTEIVRVLDEVSFAAGAFAARAVEVLETGDAAALAAYAPEATSSFVGLARVLEDLNVATQGAPSCSVEVGPTAGAAADPETSTTAG